MFTRKKNKMISNETKSEFENNQNKSESNEQLPSKESEAASGVEMTGQESSPNEKLSESHPNSLNLSDASKSSDSPGHSDLPGSPNNQDSTDSPEYADSQNHSDPPEHVDSQNQSDSTESPDHSEKQEKRTMILPIVPLRGMTVLPGMMLRFDLSRKASIEAAQYAMENGQLLCVIGQVDPNLENPEKREDLCTTATLVRIRQLVKMTDSSYKIMVEGVRRLNLLGIVDTVPFMRGMVAPITEEEELEGLDPVTAIAMTRTLQETVHDYAQSYPKISKTLELTIEGYDRLGQQIDHITSRIPIGYRKKQDILDTILVTERFSLIGNILLEEINVASVKTAIASEVSKSVEKNQKDFYLKEQMKAIRKEMGDTDEGDAEKYRRLCEELNAPEEIKEAIRYEVSRLERLGYGGSEGAVQRAYIETLLELPWNNRSQDNDDLAHAEQILNEDHYGMEDVKERILEQLAVRSLKKDGQSTVLCLVGPPGTGKTSIAKSIARALDRKYVRVCLGGVRDEAEIRGHRKTYIGAMPGRIAQGLKQAGVSNPVMLLDELDKAGSDQRGDTASALLEVLDGEQNHVFRDHYVELPMDLSQVFFICTANSLEEVARPLRDRMEIISVSSYTENEKFHIAKEHLVAKQREQAGLSQDDFQITDRAIRDLIQQYTREAGVRELERQIGSLCRKRAKSIVQGNDKVPEKIKASGLKEYLGKPKYRKQKNSHPDQVGVVNGLAWTSVGGDVLEVEVGILPGKGDLVLTGKMGDVMKESASIALALVRSIGAKYGVADNFFEEKEIHLHIPEGAVPKDGPSAGITMTTAILSACAGIPVRGDLAMTGEVTLRGRVLPIGGLKEKLLAAKTAGMTTVLVPIENESDVAEFSEEILDGIEVKYVKTIENVFAMALAEEKKAPGKRKA